MITIEEAMSITEGYGPAGDDINETYQIAIALLDEVKRLNSMYLSAVKGRADFRNALREERAEQPEARKPVILELYADPEPDAAGWYWVMLAIPGGAYHITSKETEAEALAFIESCRPQAVSSWQPIKTAPKDGTVILVAVTSTDLCYTVEWRDEAENEEVKDGKGIGWRLTWDGYYFPEYDQPTHWMPLPDAPLTIATQGA